MRLVNTVVAAILALAVAACGGGNASSTAAPQAQNSATGDSESTASGFTGNPTGNPTANDDREKGALIEGQYIVLLRKPLEQVVGVDLSMLPLLEQVESVLGSVGGELLTTFEHAVSGFVARLSPDAAARLRQNPLVALVEQDSIVTVAGVQSNAPWGLDRIDQPTLPLDSLYQYAGDGAGSHVYIVDTGIRSSHNEFSGRVGNGRNFVESGFLFTSVRPEDTGDCNGHGTHVAGVVAGDTWGVAKGATLYPVRVLGCGGSGPNSAVIAGIDWVTANHRAPAVANLSIGGGPSAALDAAVQGAINAGVTMVIAAGNDNIDACIGSPNRVLDALTVAATTRSDTRSAFSNWGSCVDVFAPGSGISSAWNSSDRATAELSGTSMAAPHVAGAAALVLAARPDASPAKVADILAQDAARGRVLDSRDSPNRLVQISAEGGGDRPPLADFDVDCTALYCAFDASRSSDDQRIDDYQWQFGDGQRGSGQRVAHNYSDYGTVTAQLTVTDNTGQQDSTQMTFTLRQPGTAPCSDCQASSGSLSGDGVQRYLPGAGGFSFSGGELLGVLSGPTTADFDIYLERLDGVLFFQSWTVVARSVSASSEESIRYQGAAGTYRWRIRSYAGSGAYTFYTNQPD